MFSRKRIVKTKKCLILKILKMNLKNLNLVELEVSETSELNGGELITNYPGGSGAGLWSFLHGFYDGFIQGIHGN